MGRDGPGQRGGGGVAGAGLGPLAAPACGSRDLLARGLAEGQGRAEERRVGGGGVRAAAAPGTLMDPAWAALAGGWARGAHNSPSGEGTRGARVSSRARGPRGARGRRVSKVSPGGES